MADTTALSVAQAFEECVYRRFGAPTLIRHDRDPRIMSEVFQAFAETMQSRSRATLSYWPQANGQQERSVRIVMQSVRVYAEDPLQQDWDEIAEKLVFAINNSPRKETPFYLGHGWDARTTLRVMSSSLKRGLGRQTDALAWRREMNRQQEIALKMAKEFQVGENARRAMKHNETLSRREQSAISTRELLPEDSWEPDRLAGEYEVECILDDRTPLSTGTGRAVREIKVKWVGYDEPTWEPAANLSCGELLYDYLRAKRQDQRLQMVQVADEN
ncbi:unnamed protein product [Phytophthora lilii]|uniref:Unnamed protein product n=1 Tax=Phytophthora lilii TaxID=2077276 RepID=A0A9W6T9G6_9STRA|nr:unnamed protein product [Phytophthora lilii]